MKNLSLLTIIALFFLSSCNKETQYEEGNDSRREEIKQRISLHSKGLKFFFNRLEEATMKTKSSDQPLLPPEFVGENIQAFLNDEMLPLEGLDIISSEISNGNSVILSALDYDIQFSNNLYLLALDIINTSGTNILEVTTNINSILNTNLFLSLPQIEQDILLIGAETYIDSYTYWETELSSWEPLSAKLNPDRIRTKSWWSKVKQYAKADGKGAIAGAIGGALGGAAVGAMAGGVGAGPGAVTGAVGGGIATGVTNSVLEVMEDMNQTPIIREFNGDITLNNDLIIPEMWTKISLPEGSAIPSAIQYNNGDFTITY